jgi:phosphoserine phosphatase RsbU/P
MDTKNHEHKEETKLVNLLREDFRRGDFKRSVQRDFEELKEFFLNENRKKRLAQMSWLSRGLYTFGWLLKSLFLKLNPARRILLVVAVVLLIVTRDFQFQGEQLQINFNFTILSGIIILFILMLELKDKMLARNELEAGRAVQHAFMPDKSPDVPGWSIWLFTRTANEVGGDLVDFQKIDEHRFGLSLADVAGKGLSAALLMAKLQATIRALAPDFDLLNELGTKINKIFCRDSVRSFFASLVYLQIKSDSNIMRILNAGHLPPILINRLGIKEVQKGDPAIGLMPDSDYREHGVEFQPGDLIIVYSDGITDAKNELDEFFGTQRLLKILSSVKNNTVKEIGEQILKGIEDFIGQKPLYDDLSLVIIKRENIS